MERENARRLAEFLSSHSDSIQEGILSALPSSYSRLAEPYLREWLTNQVDYLRGREDRTKEWVALVTDMMQVNGFRVYDILAQVGTIRRAIMAFCQGHIEGLPEAALLTIILEVEDRYVSQIADYCGQGEKERIAAERRRQRSIAESVDSPFVILDPEGAILLANSHFAQEVGASSDSVQSQDLTRFCDTATAGEVRRVLRQRRAAGPQTFQGRFGPVNGRPIPAEFLVQPLFDAAGRRDSLAITIRLLQKPQPHIQDFLDYIKEEILHILPTAIQVLDRERRIVYRNPVAQNIFVPNCDEETPYCCHFLSGGDAGQGLCACEDVFARGEIFVSETHIEANGDLYWYRLVLVPLRAPGGEVLQVACALRDITRERALERGLEDQILQHQRTSVASQVAVTVAHQLRNPLGVIVGFAQMLTKGLPPEQVPGAVDRILRNGLRCKEIVEDLLRFGQGFPGERVPTELTHLVHTLVQPMIPGSQNSRIAWHLPPETGAIECVPNQLAHVFICLLNNALNEGATHVAFEVTHEERHILVRVQDNGPGVPEDLQERIFQPFFTTHADNGAVGLGLSLSQAVVHDYGGRLYLETNNAPGACFVVRLPLVTGPVSSVPLTPVAPAVTGVPENCGRILVVDDELDLLEMLEMVLELRGYAVTPAATAAEAIAMLQNATFDALVLDVQLPGDLNGPQFFEFLSQSHLELARRTLFITADTMNYETRKFLERVRRPSMEKPFLVDDFVAQVEKLFKEAPSKE